MKIIERPQIEVRQHVGVMQQKRLAVAEKPCRVFQAAAGIQQQAALVGNLRGHAVMRMRCDKFVNRVGKRMGVDDDMFHARRLHPAQDQFEHRRAVNFDKGFGAGIRERAQARSQACGENHGVHASFLRSGLLVNFRF